MVDGYSLNQIFIVSKIDLHIYRWIRCYGIESCVDIMSCAVVYRRNEVPSTIALSELHFNFNNTNRFDGIGWSETEESTMSDRWHTQRNLISLHISCSYSNREIFVLTFDRPYALCESTMRDSTATRKLNKCEMLLENAVTRKNWIRRIDEFLSEIFCHFQVSYIF